MSAIAWNAVRDGNGITVRHQWNAHLGTPQLATTKEGQTSWKAQSEAFGAAGVLQNQSSISMNLRFPGQYFDSETNTHYNFHRDYRPNQGRYLQGDPIGMLGGRSVFAYGFGSPLRNSDPTGTVVVGEWSPRPYLTTAIQFRGFKPLAFPGSSDDPEQWELKFPTLTLALVGFYFQFDALIIAGVKCKDIGNCSDREWYMPYEKRFVKTTHVDLGINIPVGIYGASRGGGLGG